MKAIVPAVLALLAAVSGGAASAAPAPANLPAASNVPVVLAPPLKAVVKRTYASKFSTIPDTIFVPPGYATLYVNSMQPAPTSQTLISTTYGNIEEQTESVLGKIQKALKAQGLDLGDLVSMHVYLVYDSDNKYTGSSGSAPLTPINSDVGQLNEYQMMQAFSQHFHTPAQPNSPIVTIAQVSDLGVRGIMVQIDAVAVKQVK